MTKPSTIAIDGPAGSGKSTISFFLAERLGYLFVDTGVFYRTITLLALRKAIAFDNTKALGEMTHNAEIDIRPEPDDAERQYSVWLEGEDVTDQLRSSAVENNVSTLAAVPEVRQALMHVQRRAAAQGNIIMAGRDIGTVILPNADLKLYIDASLPERAQRRYRQKLESGEAVNLHDIEAALIKRDETDKHRDVSPLRQADDAIYILTDNLTIDEVIDRILAIFAD